MMIDFKNVNSAQYKQNALRYWQKRTFAQKIALVIIALVFLWIFSGIIVPHHDKITAQPQNITKRVTVETVVNILHSPILNVTGRTEAQKRVDIVALTAGTVEAIPIPKGNLVKQGDIIVRLASDGRGSAVEDAKSLLAQKNAELLAQQQLLDNGFISRKTINDFKTQAATAKTNYERAIAERDRAAIRAPFSGLLNDMPVDVAQSVRVGDKIATLVQLNPLKIIGEVSERSVVRLNAGQEITIESPDNVKLKGKLSYVSRSAVGATRTFRIEGLVENDNLKIPEGASVTLSVSLSQQLATKIKRSALTLSDKGVIGVRIMKTDSTAQFVPITIVDDTQDELWVTGIDHNAKMITVGQDFVIDGEKIIGVDAAQGAQKP